MSGLGIDHTGSATAPSITSGAWLLPNTLVVAEVKPNVVVVEGADGTTATATSGGHAAGLGQIGEYVQYSYVLDSSTLQDIADTRLANNIATVAATVEVASAAHWRPWADYYVGDIVWVDIGAGMPAGWYRVERIAGRLTNEAEGFRYVVDVGRAVVSEEAAVADRLAAILRAGLIDLETGLVTSTSTGQATTTVVVTTSDIPAHTHAVADVTDFPQLGGDVTGTIGAAKVERVNGYEVVSNPAPDEGDVWQWNDTDQGVMWGHPPVQHAFSIGGALEVGTGTLRLPIIRDLHIVGCYATAAVAPTGSSAIFDVNLNGTSIYATTPANRPTIADAANGSQSPPPLPDTVACSAGDYLTVDVDQIGATTSGEDVVLVVQFGRDLS